MSAEMLFLGYTHFSDYVPLCFCICFSDVDFLLCFFFFQTLFVVICSFVEQVVSCFMIVDQLQKPLPIHPVYVMALTLFCGVSNRPYLDAFNVLTLGIRRGGGGGGGDMCFACLSGVLFPPS